MTSSKRSVKQKHRGITLIISMIFVLVFSALAVSMATLSGTNVQLAENQRKANCARACAESGLEIIRLWLSHVSISGTTAETLKLREIANSFQSAAYDISNVMPIYDGSSKSVLVGWWDRSKKSLYHIHSNRKSEQ